MKKSGLDVLAFDGTANIANLTEGLVSYRDLSTALTEKPRDWVVSLEVGEHIKKEFEDTFLSNVALHAERGVILSWAVPGQGGSGHVNEQSNEHIRDKMHSLGFTALEELTADLRATAELSWLKQTLMAFAKDAASSASESTNQ